MKPLAFVVAVAALFGAAGCSSEDSAGNGTYVAPTAQDTKKKIAEIDANPNMPPQAKAMQKAMLEKNGTGQTTQGKKE